MSVKQISATARTQVGKGAARAVRREGKVPAVIYGAGKPPLSIALDAKEANKLVYAGHFLTTVFEIEVDGSKTRAIPRDYALDPVKDTVELCQPDLDRRHLTVRADIPHDLPSVMIDLLQIEQVLINLVRNATDALGESNALRGTIAIDARAANADFVEVRVSDTGPGFPSPMLENAFVPLSSIRKKES